MAKRTRIGTIIVALAAALGATPTMASRAQQPVPDVTLEPASIDFGDQVVGQTSHSRRVTVTNTGQASLYIKSASLEGDNVGDFALAGDACTGKTIPAGKSCVVDVVMTAKAVGRRVANVVVRTNAPGGMSEIGLSGNGINSSAVPPQ